MTWSAIQSAGRGQAQFRLQIEGVKYEFVSHPDMEGASGDFTRVFGLAFNQPLEINEKIIIQEGKIDASGMTVVIEEQEDLEATEVFGRRPRTLAYIASNIGTSDPETITLSDVSRISVGDIIHAGTEAMKVTAKDGGASTVTVDRAALGTIVQEHYAGADLRREQPIFDGPGTWRHRRARLFAHGPSEFGTGDSGTLIWRGILKVQPKLRNPVRWTIEMDPISKILDQDLGGELDRPLRIRGAYHPGINPFFFKVQEWDATSQSGSPDRETDFVSITGHFETPEDLAAEVTSQIQSETSAFDNTYGAQALGDQIVFTALTRSPARWFHIIAGSLIEPNTAEQGQPHIKGGPPAASVEDSSEYEAYTPFMPWPRSGNESSMRRPERIEDDFTDIMVGSPPANRFYVDELVGISAGSDAVIRWKGWDGAEKSITREVLSVNASDGYFRIDRDPLPSPNAAFLDRTAEIKSATSYGSGDLNDFNSELRSKSVEANRGVHPFVTSDDIPILWGAVDQAAEERGYPAQRRNFQIGKPVNLEDFLAQHSLFYGLYPYLDSSEKIGLRLLRGIAGTEPTVKTIDGSIVLDGKGKWPQWGLEEDGIVNVVDIETGYDPLEDKHTGTSYRVREETSIALHKKSDAVEIAPQSTIDGAETPEAGTVDRIDYEDAVDIVQPLLATFGYNYEIVTIHVNWKAWDVRCGDVVDVSVDHIPDFSADEPTRGFTSRIGLVIERSWRLPGHGKLRILMAGETIAGYAPAARVTDATDNGSNSWTLTVESNRYAPSGSNDSDFFETDDHVVVVEFDADSPDTETGQVTGKTDTTITVQFDAQPPWGAGFSGTYNLRFRRDGASTTPTTHQQRYNYIADSSKNKFDGSTADEFAA